MGQIDICSSEVSRESFFLPFLAPSVFQPPAGLVVTAMSHASHEVQRRTKKNLASGLIKDHFFKTAAWTEQFYPILSAFRQKL